MEDALLDGGEWLDGPDGLPLLPPLPPYLIPPHFGRGEDVGADTGVDTEEGGGDRNEGKEISDAMILDIMDTYMDVAGVDPPQTSAGGLLMDDTSTTPQVSTTPVPQDPSTPQPTSQPHEPLQDSENDDFCWKRFDILPSAPADHAFFSKPIAQPSRAFMARLHKEYRALSTGLPGGLALIHTTDTTLISNQPRLSYGPTKTEETSSVHSSSAQKTHPTKMLRSLSTGC